MFVRDTAPHQEAPQPAESEEGPEKRMVEWRRIIPEHWDEIAKYYKRYPTAAEVMRWLKRHSNLGVIAPAPEQPQEGMAWVTTKGEKALIDLKTMQNALTDLKKEGLIPSKPKKSLGGEK